MGFSCLRFSKKKLWPGLSKLSIAMFLFFFLLISNPLYWPEQIARHIDTSRVIQPNDPLVQQLNGSAYLWAYLNETYGITPSYFYNNMTDDQRLENMTEYILNEVIEYHLIPDVYGVIDYTASAHEAISHGKGDCQSRTVVMVSFFIFMGYDAYCCETPYHWYTCVFLGPNKTDPHYYYRINWTDPQIMFNHEEKFYTMNIFERLGDTIFGFPFYDKIVEMFSITLVLYLLPFGLLGMGFLMTLAIESTDWKSRKTFLKDAIFCGIILICGFFGAYGFGFLIPQLTLFFMILTIILAAQSTHSNIGSRIFALFTKE